MKRAMLVVAASLFVAAQMHADDWPQWRGPRRDNISIETGVLREWPKEGSNLLWMVDGVVSMAVANGRWFVSGIH
jgi:hypothetical protein